MSATRAQIYLTEEPRRRIDGDVEGIVLKRLRSSYRPGRSRHWRKVKVPSWAALHAQRRRPQ